jgi:hypothetical protein
MCNPETLATLGTHDAEHSVKAHNTANKYEQH